MIRSYKIFTATILGVVLLILSSESVFGEKYILKENINCSQSERSFSEIDDTTKAIIESCNEFGMSLFLKSGCQNRNMVISPVSLYNALAIAYTGAFNETADQMRRLLIIKQEDNAFQRHIKRVNCLLKSIPQSDNGKFLNENSLWIEKRFPIIGSYIEAVNDCYFAAIKSVEFRNSTNKACDEINKWASMATNNKINKIFNKVSDDTKLIIVNAVYFISNWKKEFDSFATSKKVFNRSPKDSVLCPMMSGKKERVPFYENNEIQCLQLPYKTDGISAIFILPKTTWGLNKCETNLNTKTLWKWIDSSKKMDVNVCLPAFKIETVLECKKLLMDMGMVLPFTESADFSRISKARTLIDDIVHATFIKVDEKGTEAAAVTGICFKELEEIESLRPTKEFLANHPFLMIVINTKLRCILFVSRIINPS